MRLLQDTSEEPGRPGAASSSRRPHFGPEFCLLCQEPECSPRYMWGPEDVPQQSVQRCTWPCRSVCRVPSCMPTENSTGDGLDTPTDARKQRLVWNSPKCGDHPHPHTDVLDLPAAFIYFCQLALCPHLNFQGIMGLRVETCSGIGAQESEP